MPAYHLPYIAGVANGLFAEHGLNIEVLEPADGPANVLRVADGGSDACLTSVSYYLEARTFRQSVPARFCAVVMRRHPIAALVAADSRFQRPADLVGSRLGGMPDDHLVQQLCAAFGVLGLRAPSIVPMSYEDAPAALKRGEIDALADFVDLVPRTRRDAGIDIRAVPFNIDIYANGLVVADRVQDDVVDRLRTSVTAALRQQQNQPRAGLAELIDRYPELVAADVEEEWDLLEPNVFAGNNPGSMDEAGWTSTLAFYATAHGYKTPDPRTVYRLG